MKITPHVGYQKTVALLNELNIELIVIGLSVHALLYDLKGNRGHVKRLKQSLILLVGRLLVFFYVKQHEFLQL